MKTLFLSFFLLGSIASYAQTSVVSTDSFPIFTKVEVYADFPGGNGAWAKYITKEINKYIDALTEDGKSGTCRVRFIVDKEGNVSNVVALNMKGSKLAEIAVKAIKSGPKWHPATQNGKPVNAYRIQPVTFMMPDGGGSGW
jgi:periplasmic protein TonB